MKLYEIYLAWNGISAVYKLKNLSYAQIRKIRDLLDLARKECECYLAEERKLIDIYALKDSDGTAVHDGKISFGDSAAVQEYLARLETLRNTEIDLQIEPVKIQAAEIGDQKIPCSGEDLERAQKFIEIGG